MRQAPVGSKSRDVDPSPSPKPERISKWLIAVILAMAMVPSAICCIFFFGSLYGTFVFVLCGGVLPIIGWFLKLRQSPVGEVDRQIDNAMGKPSDDPRQMARWVP